MNGYDLHTALLVLYGVLAAVGAPALGYIVRRRDKALDDLRRENRDGHQVIHAKLDTLETHRADLGGAVKALEASVAGLQTDVRDLRRSLLGRHAPRATDPPSK